MKKRSKGFTLIELLAVIVILAIIALIATPIILNIIENSKKSAFVDTAYGLIEAAKLEYTEGILHNNIGEKNYTFPQGGVDKLEFSGGEPQGGNIKVTDKGNISIAIHDGTWCVMKDGKDSEVTISKYEKDKCVLPKEVTPEKCFQIEDYEKKEYIVNQDQCISYLISRYNDEEDATKKCAGDIDSFGETLESSIMSGTFTVEQLESAGAITVTNSVIDGVMITKYHKSDADCPIDVVIPETINGKVVKAIGEYAFLEKYNDGTKQGDSKLINSVVFPSGLEVIKSNAFIGKKGSLLFNAITSLDFSKAKNLTVIGFMAFSDNQLTDVDFSNLSNLTYLGGFTSNQISSVNLKGLSKLRIIGYSAFLFNQLTTIDLSELTSLEMIDAEAFYDNQLTSVDFSNLTNLITIGFDSFRRNSITSTNFRNLNNLKSINLAAFTMNQLTNVDLSNLPKLERIGESAFLSNQIKTINLSNTHKIIIEARAFNNNQLPENQAFIYARKDDGSEDKTTIVSYGGAEKENVIIPNGVKVFAEYSFSEGHLTGVVIPESIVEIGKYSFIFNELTSVTMPNSVVTIGESAFSNNQLTNVIIPSSVTEINDWAFNRNKLTTVVIPSSVTTIGGSAFSSNQLTSVTIKGKSSSTEFTSYPKFTPFGWATGYSDSNIIWNG